MKIQLSDHFTYKMLLRFVLPSIIMMVFTSIYGVVDGLFVSNFVGKTPFAAVNLVMPFIMVFGGIGFMFGTGGSALVAKTMGEGDKRRANQYFTMMMVSTLICGVIISVLGVVFMETTPVSYRCYCTRQRVEKALISLGRKELTEIADEGKAFPVECQFCDKIYSFTPEDIRELLKRI